MRLSYDDAVIFLKENGVGCDPCSDLEGEYVCDLLDDMPDGYDHFEQPYYTKSTLKYIIERVKEYVKNMRKRTKKMKYKIYQLKNIETCSYSFMSWRVAHDKFKIEHYQEVYEGSIESKDNTKEISTKNYLEHLFYIFNCNHPKDFKGHSLSVNDIVELKGLGKFYCDSAGWQKLDLLK